MTKKFKWVKTALVVFGVSLLMSMVYLISKGAMAVHGWYYQNWVVIIGEAVLFLILPMSFFAAAIGGCHAAAGMGKGAAEADIGESENAVAAGASTASRGTAATEGATVFEGAMADKAAMASRAARAGFRCLEVFFGLSAFLYFLLGIPLYRGLRSDVFEEERILDNGIIEAVSQVNPWEEGGRLYRYYEPVFPFFKKRYFQMSEVMKRKAEEKHGEPFAVSDEDIFREKEKTVSVYTLYPESDPSVEVHMFSNAVYFYYLQDDYPQAKANALFSQDEALGENVLLPEKVDTENAYTPGNAFTGRAVVSFPSLEQAAESVQPIADVVNKALEEELYARDENRASIIVEYGEAAVLITFGDMRGCRVRYQDYREDSGYGPANYDGDVLESDSAEAGMIVKALWESYRDYVALEEQKRQEEQAGKGEQQEGQAGTGQQQEGQTRTGQQQEGQAGTGQQQEGQAGAGEQQEGQDEWEQAFSTPSTVEGACKCLYEQVFEPLGDDFDCRYNAKGNFYAVLSIGKGKLDSEDVERDTMRSLVYDRVSRNNACHLFVYYETFYNEDGSEYTTAIRNTYAVNMATGEVTKSGKRAWADVGSKAYQEAAGEK